MIKWLKRKNCDKEISAKEIAEKEVMLNKKRQCILQAGDKGLIEKLHSNMMMQVTEAKGKNVTYKC